MIVKVWKKRKNYPFSLSVLLNETLGKQCDNVEQDE